MGLDSNKDDPMQNLIDITNELHGYCSPDNHCRDCDGHLWDCEFCGAFQSMVCCDRQIEKSKKVRKEIARKIENDSP